MYVDNIFFITFKQIPREEKKQHAKNLNDEIYKRLSWVWVEREPKKYVLKVPEDHMRYHNYMIMGGAANPNNPVERPSDVDIDHLTNSDLALKHLEKYHNIYKPWNEAHDKLNELNGTSLSDEQVNAKEEKIHNLLKQFRKELKVLIRHIEAGAILKGKCCIGY